MEKKGDYLSQHLPPEYMESPMLLLDSWDDVVPKVGRIHCDKPERACRL